MRTLKEIDRDIKRLRRKLGANYPNQEGIKREIDMLLDERLVVMKYG